MRISNRCAACLYAQQERATNDADYLREVKYMLDHRTDEDNAPYMIYKFNLLQEKRFGKPVSYKKINESCNDLVLSMEDSLRRKLQDAEDPLALSIAYARVGNYIDFGAMSEVDSDAFLALFKDASLRGADLVTYASFLRQCETAHAFLLLADNSGEIVLDKLFLEELHRRFPHLKLRVMVRGGEALNDATMEDALYAGIDQVAEVLTNGYPVVGTIYEMLPEEAKQAFDESEVILSKGQGNYESLGAQGRHVFYSFLCKCDFFTEKFQVPRLTGMFIEEGLTE